MTGAICRSKCLIFHCCRHPDAWISRQLHRPLSYNSFRQTHSKDCDGEGEQQHHDEHRDVIDDRQHQLVVSGRHLLDGSRQRALGVGSPVECVGEERVGKRHKTPADAILGVIPAAPANEFGNCRKDDEPDGKRCVDIACNQ